MQPSTQNNPPEPELAYLLGSTAAHGITIGSPLTIPEGYAGVVVVKNQALDAVGPGQYTVDATTFPQLAAKLKLRPGEAPKAPIDLTFILLNITGAVLSWRAQPLVSKDSARGLTYCDIAGRCAARVTNPAQFYNAMQAGLNAFFKRQPALRAQFAAMPLGQQAAFFVSQIISSSAANALGRMNMAPEQLPSAAQAVNQAIGSTAAASFAQIGLELTGFEVTNTPQALRAPCAKCGSTTAPTAYGVYRRTISLFYIRFGARREGNFCVPCAAKVWGSYCGVMLVCGWWGIIGIVLTPIYICQNTYYFIRTAFGPKLATGPVADGEANSAWPAAAAEWGQEVQEK